MVGKPRFRLSNQPDKNGVKTDGGVTQYTITVAAKDGRYKYEITDVNWKQISVFPSERWMDTKSSSYSPAYNDYLQQLDKTALEVIAALKKQLLKQRQLRIKTTGNIYLIKASAMIRSVKTVIFKFDFSPSTRWIKFPSCSKTLASSVVSLSGFSYAFRISSR